MASPLGSTPGIIIGVGVGTAVAAALEPAIELPKQEAWQRNPNRVLDPGTMARLVAQGGVELGAAQDAAERHGFDADKLDALVYLSQTVPAIGEAFNLWRRGILTDALWEHVLVKNGLDPDYYGAYDRAKLTQPLDPADVARGIHRGLIPDPGLLEGVANPGPGKVPAYPVYEIDALKEAASHGYNHDRLGVLVGLQGNPMGPHEAAQALFRGVLVMNDYLRALSESNTRNEWADAILAQSRQIPTARDFLENALRGYRTLAAAIEGASLHGMTEEHATLIYQNQGRPMNLRQITQAQAWGAKFNPEPGEIQDPYHASTVEGPIKPGYYELFESLKYALPSALYFRTLQQHEVLSEAEAHTWYLRLGWPPELAAQVAKAYATPAGATGKTVTKSELADEYETGFISEAEYRTALEALGFTGHQQDLEVLHSDAAAVKAERSRVVTALHKLYEQHSIDEATARANLAQTGMHAASIDRIMPLWNIERDAARAQLTAAQVKRAYRKNIFTRDQALAALEERNYSPADAATYLDE